MKKLLKIVKSPWFDLLPAAAFIVIAGAEGKAYWLGGVMAIVWLFAMALRHLVAK
jgi:hypothetical protein